MITKSKPTNEQLTLAKRLKVDISSDTQRVAAARLMDAVAIAIGIREGEVPVTEGQLDFAQDLGIDVTKDSKRIASAKISDKFDEDNMLAIVRMNLTIGDEVYLKEDYEMSDCTKGIYPRKFIISTIKSNGRIWFKGGNGAGAWASQIVKVGFC